MFAAEANPVSIVGDGVIANVIGAITLKTTYIDARSDGYLSALLEIPPQAYY